MFSLEGVSEDVVQFKKSCDRLLSALTRDTKLSESERELIAYYCRVIVDHTRSPKDEHLR